MHWVFAYGSNMNLPDLARWLREQGHAGRGPSRVEPARIEGYALTWNYRSRVRRGGAANATPRAGAELRGVALGVDADLLAAIDRKEGHPQRYDRGSEPVQARLLRRQGSVAAWLYRVTPAYLAAHAVPPRRAYLDLLVEAARDHDLGRDYVTQLRRTATLP